MSRRSVCLALVILISGASYAASPSTGLEGNWENPEHTTVVNVKECGRQPEYCAVVLRASAKTQENARKGGTTNFIGVEVLRVHPVGDGVFRGTAFDPESNMHVKATARMARPGIMELKGCTAMGLICEEQRWTKVD